MAQRQKTLANWQIFAKSCHICDTSARCHHQKYTIYSIIIFDVGLNIHSLP